MEYIGRLFEMIQRLFTWWVVVVPWQQGVRIRMGKHEKTLYPGIHFRIPVVDRVYVQDIRIRMIQLPPQTVSTVDKHTLTIVMSVGYSVTDLRRVYNTLANPEITLGGFIQSEVAEYIAGNEYVNCRPFHVEQHVTRVMKDMDYGLEFKSVRITGYAEVRTYRLIMDGHYQSNLMDTTTKER